MCLYIFHGQMKNGELNASHLSKIASYRASVRDDFHVYVATKLKNYYRFKNKHN